MLLEIAGSDRFEECTSGDSVLHCYIQYLTPGATFDAHNMSATSADPVDREPGGRFLTVACLFDSLEKRCQFCGMFVEWTERQTATMGC